MSGLPPLFDAVLFQKLSQLRRLLAKPGVRLEAPGPVGTTVIFAAIEEYFNESTSSGDKAGCAPRREGGPAYEVLKLLLVAGSSPNAVFRNPSTGSVMSPLSILAQHGLIEGVRLFLAHARDLDVMVPTKSESSSFCMWPIQSAVAAGHLEIARALIGHPSFDAGGDPRLLIASAEADAVGIVELLLSLPRGAALINAVDYNRRTNSYTTPLLTACYSGHGCVEALLRAGADALLTRDGRRPPPGVDPDAPRRLHSPMAAVLATGADPLLIDALVERGARRPMLRSRGGETFYVSPLPGGEEEVLRDLRSLRAGDGVFVMRGNPGRAFGGGMPDPPGCVPKPPPAPGSLLDDRFEKFKCAAPSCGKAPTIGASLLRCGRCREVSYCDESCQREHWRAGHKAVCKGPEK